MTAAAVVDEANEFVAVLVPAFAVGLAIVHLIAGKLRFLDVIPRSRWLSMAGGVSVAYIFVRVLPEIGAAARSIDQSGLFLASVEYHIYLIVLIGFVLFYGLEGFVRKAPPNAESDETETDGVFWVHIGSFAIYNALVGYLLVHREEPGIVSLIFFFVAMALHFVVNDFGLRAHHERIYHQYGRWILSGAVIFGFMIGYVTMVSEFLLAILFAFLAGSVIFNVIKEELPSERESRFWPFAAGVTGYTLLLLGI